MIEATEAEMQMRVSMIELEALKLLNAADRWGVSLRIDRVPLQPLATGNMTYKVEVWPKRVMAKKENSQ